MPFRDCGRRRPHSPRASGRLCHRRPAARGRGPAAAGCKVGLVARRREHLETLAKEIEQAGGTAAFAAADVGDRGPTLAAIHDLAARLGPVDLLVANAGVGAPTLLDPMNIGDIE